ncbi:MAG: DUF5930 domain-containing protein [Pseudomonadota bacterium]
MYKPTLKTRLNAALERSLPEQRLYLKSDEGMRYFRLSSGVQAAIVLGSALFVGWTAVVTAIFLIAAISAGDVRDQAQAEQLAYREALNDMASERNDQLREAREAQDHFSRAIEQVSEMQSRLLASEERRRELETAVNVIQATLRRTIQERDIARQDAERYLAEIQTETGVLQTSAEERRATEATLDLLIAQLEAAALERDGAASAEAEAFAMIDELQYEAALARDRSERIFTQIEDAVTASMTPLEEMFDATGLATEQILGQVRRNYSGQGGPLTPIISTRGEAPDATTERANEVFGLLDELNVYRLAAEQIPFSFPIRGNSRFTSGFGPRWGRMHNGVDYAGRTGTPIIATADGVVTFAGTQSGYGRMVEVRHAYGYVTRYAHLHRIRVSEGQRVSRGERIGDMGNTGRSTGTHLHYEVRINGDPINPMTYITAGQNVF